MIDEPARVDRMTRAAPFRIARKQYGPVLVRGSGQTRRADLKLPKLVGIARALLLDRVGLLDGGRPKDVDFDSRQHLLQTRFTPATDVRILRHLHEIFERARVRDVALAEKPDFVAQGFW